MGEDQVKRKIGQRKVKYMMRLVALGGAILSLIVTLITGMNCLIKQGSLVKNNTQLKKLTEEKARLEAQIATLKEEVAATKERTEELQDIVWANQEIVIPDSMK